MPAKITFSRIFFATGKKEFLDKASVVFDDSREDNLKEKLALERKEKAEIREKNVGQLNHAGGLVEKKILKKHLDLTTRVNLVRNLLKTKEFPIKQVLSFLESTAPACTIMEHPYLRKS